MSSANALYDEDFLRWTEEQAAGLRRAKDSNLPLDWENLAEEIESLGKSQRRELGSQIRRILHHLLKPEASPAEEPRAGWCASVRAARADVQELLEESPSLRRDVERLIERHFSVAADLAAADLVRHREAAESVRRRLQQGGFTAEQVLGDWVPERQTADPGRRRRTSRSPTD